MKLRANNLREALLPLDVLCAFIGYGFFQYPIGRPRAIFSLIYTIITVVLYYFAITYNLLYIKPLPWSTSAKKVVSAALLANIGAATFTQIINLCNSKAFQRIYQRLMAVDVTLQKLGATISFDETMKGGIIIIIYWLITLIGLNWSDAVLIPSENSFVTRIWYCTTVNHAIHVNAFVSLYFLHVLRILKLRFSTVNDLIEDCFKSCYQQTRRDYRWSLWLFRNSKVNPTFRISLGGSSSVDDEYKRFIQTIKHVHLELMLVTRQFDQMFGILMALQAASIFISVTGLMYDVVRTITSGASKIWGWNIFSLTIWILVPFAHFMMINGSCDGLGAEAKRTGSLIHGIDNSIGDKELHDEIKQFSLQLLEIPLDVSPLGFFTLNYSLGISFINSILTYLAILLQSDGDTGHLDFH